MSCKATLDILTFDLYVEFHFTASVEESVPSNCSIPAVACDFLSFVSRILWYRSTKEQP